MMMLEIFLRLHSFENKYYLQHHLGGVSVHFYFFLAVLVRATN